MSTSRRGLEYGGRFTFAQHRRGRYRREFFAAFRLRAGLAPDAARLSRWRIAPAAGSGDARRRRAHRRWLLCRPPGAQPGARRAAVARWRCHRVERPADAAGFPGRSAHARPAGRNDDRLSEHGPCAGRQGRRQQARRRQGGQRRLSAARALEAAQHTRCARARQRRCARPRHGVGRCLVARCAAVENGRHAAAWRRGVEDRAHRRHRARPRSRLHELCAARDGEPRRPRCHAVDPAGEPRQLPSRGGVPGQPRCRGVGIRALGRRADCQAATARRARRVDGIRPPGDEADARPREEILEPRRAARGVAGCGGGGDCVARVR